MSGLEDIVAIVKQEITIQSADTATVSLLRKLLSTSKADDRAGLATVKSTTARNPTVKHARSKSVAVLSSRSSKKTSHFEILEDGVTPLAPRSQYALATEVVNTTLKVLGDASKSQTPASKSGASKEAPTEPLPNTKRRARTIGAQDALQERPGNTVPVEQDSRPTSSSIENCVSPASKVPVAAVAECARIAFCYLRDVKTAELGLKDRPFLQLETGAIALVSRLTSLNLIDLAWQELKAVKNVLEASAVRVKAAGRERNHQSTPQLLAKECESFLLQLNVGDAPKAEMLSVAISHSLLVLQLMHADQRPKLIEDALPHLRYSTDNSLINLILLQACLFPDPSRSGKHMENLARALLKLCPSVSQSADSEALDTAKSPSPTHAFELQVLALRTRRQARQFLSQLPDDNKELIEPFSKCLAAFARRVGDDFERVYPVVKTSLLSLNLKEELRVSTTFNKAVFTIQQTIATLAESAGIYDEAYEWASAAVECCKPDQEANATYIVALARSATVLQLSRRVEHSVDMKIQILEQISERLERKFSGNSLDYEILLAELHKLLRGAHSNDESSMALREQVKTVFLSTASFAMRYARSYPERSIDTVLGIISLALSHIKSNEDLRAWITHGTAEVLVRTGCVGEVARHAATKPLRRAWTCCKRAVELAAVLNVLVMKAASASAETAVSVLFDDEQLPSEQRAPLLEYELQAALGLAHKSKFKRSLQVIVPALVARLSQLYDPLHHPLRAARVCVAVSRACFVHADVFTSETLADLTKVSLSEDTDPREDAGLTPYAKDLQHSLALARLVGDNQLSFENARPSLLAWHDLLDSKDPSFALETVVDDPAALAVQLASLNEYFEMLGQTHYCLSVSLLSVSLCSSPNFTSSDLCSAMVRAAKAYHYLGYSEKGRLFLDRAKKTVRDEPANIELLQLHLAAAEVCLAYNDLVGCCSALDAAQQTREAFNPKDFSHAQRRKLARLNAQAWLVHSMYLKAAGHAGESLRAASRAVRVMNSVWSDLERTSGSKKTPKPSDVPPPEEGTIDGLANKVKKLNLKPQDSDSEASVSNTIPENVLFRSAAPLMCRVLIHLSDMYKYHGIFKEANYYSQESLRIAECVRSPGLISSACQHRCRLLTAAGLLEDAELCLVHEDQCCESFQHIQILIARANLRVKTGVLQEALNALDDAERLLAVLQSVEYTTGKESFLHQESVRGAPKPSELTLRAGGGIKAKAVTKPAPKAGPKIATKATTARAAKSSQKTPSVTIPKSRTTTSDESIDKENEPSYRILQDVLAQVLLLKISVSLKLDLDVNSVLEKLKMIEMSPSNEALKRQTASEIALRDISDACNSNIALGAFLDSTLSFPAFTNLTIESDTKIDSKVSEKTTNVRKPARAKPTRTQQTSELAVQSVARSMYARGEDQVNFDEFFSTADVHAQCTRTASTSMLLSSSSLALSIECPTLKCDPSFLEHPRSYAARCYSDATFFEDDRHFGGETGWPTISESPLVQKIPASQTFQSEYVDIIPQKWTAVSMTLSETCDELYLTRYQTNQLPFVLRIPFGRNISEDSVESEFDFRAGKAEIQDIVERSNLSCHGFVDNGSKGIKSKWWSQREELDKQLHEMILSMENIWLGGFKGALSTHRRNQAALDQFRRDFETSLMRHLPSRRVTKRSGSNDKLTLNDQVLELFVGIGSDDDGEIDLDEPLTDLLYFVVEMLQVNGEFNAYDEVDFDTLVVDVLDSLRAYHDSVAAEDRSGEHLILILDRRLQIFPWESMPCLEKTSVSRLDSMSNLRQRILAMKGQATDHTQVSRRHKVSRKSGMYILNPDSDLKNTESTLGPMLSSLAKTDTLAWQGIEGKAPSEQDFVVALSNTSTLLYFGHGSGSQYIRPRAVRRLDSCSEVVWLMGCSSGALTEYDELEPSAVPLAYLVAGQRSLRRTPDSHADKSTEPTSTSICMAVVATLWDVTDKDIDRFSLNVGHEWGLWSSPSLATPSVRSQHQRSDSAGAPKTPAKKSRSIPTEPCTPQHTAKTPKTPKVRATSAGDHTPARARSLSKSRGSSQVGKRSLVEAVARSRDACYLRYLNGAAPVVYGVPVYLGE